MLQPHGEPHQAVGDAVGQAIGAVVARVGHQRRLLDERLRRSQADRQPDVPSRLDQAFRSVQVAGHLDRASRHAVLEAAELIDVGRTVAASRRLASFLGTRRDAVPRLAGHITPGSVAEADQLADLEGLVTSCFEDDGTISDRASPELASLRNQARGLRERLSRTIEELIERYADVLQDHYFTVREDRYVLPVRTDAHRRVHGIVHGHSNSGQTIYVEPREITTLGNDLMIVRSEVAREEQRVLAEL